MERPNKEIEQYFPKNVPMEVVKENLTTEEVIEASSLISTNPQDVTDILMSVTVPEEIPGEMMSYSKREIRRAMSDIDKLLSAICDYEDNDLKRELWKRLHANLECEAKDILERGY